MMIFRILLLLLSIIIAVPASAQIHYRLVILPDSEQLDVFMRFEAAAAETELQMPNWAPGSYRLVDNAERVVDLRAFADNGETREVRKKNPNTWSFSSNPGETLTVRYQVPLPVVAGAVHWSGPSNYLYVVGRKNERHELRVEAPDGWPVILGIDPEEEGRHHFVAPNYDVLADNPVSAGDLIIDTYQSQDIPHFIVLRGPYKEDVDRDYLAQVCRFVTETQADFFGGLPYDRYVWHFNITDNVDGAGGLEHLSSTQISLASGVGPRAVGVIAHEFFHLWNVKRIRSRPLGPFDYNELPQTGALWFLEGVTDYYSHLLLYRYGWWPQALFEERILSNLQAVRANDQRFKVSPYESSFRVRDANEGRGNSSGFGVNYYYTGWILGLLLDIELRAATGGARSLDDVVLALWEMTRDDQPGFEEDEIRRQLVAAGGPAMGEFYDRVVRAPGELPVEETLGKAGFRLEIVTETFVNTGMSWTPDPARGGAAVQNAAAPAEGLQRGDVTVAVGDERLDLTSRRAIQEAAQRSLGGARVGQPLVLQVRRGEETLTLTITPTAGSRQVQRLRNIGALEWDQATVRAGWLERVHLPHAPQPPVTARGGR
jgi:predicted metalloprotease with PDZ domain